MVVKIEAQTSLLYKRSCLADMASQHLLQSVVKQVGCCMVKGDILAPLFINMGMHFLPHFENPFFNSALVEDHIGKWRRCVCHAHPPLFVAEVAGISDLPSLFSVKRSLS